jgi:hypothetical protein
MLTAGKSPEAKVPDLDGHRQVGGCGCNRSSRFTPIQSSKTAKFPRRTERYRSVTTLSRSILQDVVARNCRCRNILAKYVINSGRFFDCPIPYYFSGVIG